MNDAQHHRLALPQGTRIQDFEFHRVLGHGGFGITYLGWNIALDIPVAIKEYLPADLATRESDLSVVPQSSQAASDFQWGLDRFIDKARILARFQHPNIVRVHHFFLAHSTAYIAMDYVEGETLSAFLNRKGTLTESELKAILFPLLDGLAVVHHADFLHRDIKPGNIIIRDEDASPVLLDFGAARQAIGAKSRSVTSIVTPGYAPIEQYSSRGAQGPWTDIYALGGVCYRALTGEVPDDATDRVRRDPLTPVTERCRSQASLGFLSAIDHALQVDEPDRPQSIGEWRAELGTEPVIAIPHVQEVPIASPPVAPRPESGRPQDDAPAPVAPAPSSPRRTGRGKGVWVALVACLLLGVAGIGGYWVIGEMDRRAAIEHQAELDRQKATERQAAAELESRLAAVTVSLPGGASMEMVRIEPGTFMMGSPSSESGRYRDEGPVHEVTISAGFYLGKYEVTQGQWESVMGTRPWEGELVVRSGENYPAVYISWNDAQEFIRRLNTSSSSGVYGLPSEAEWEYACRTGSSSSWSFGNAESELRHYAWYDANAWGVGEKYAHAVGRKRANPWGLYDMHGNVWEWVHDWYASGYYSRSPSMDPRGPSTGSAHVRRGGDFNDDAQDVRSANRGHHSPDFRYYHIGFRLLRRAN